jgi:hypothetical protein
MARVPRLCVRGCSFAFCVTGVRRLNWTPLLRDVCMNEQTNGQPALNLPDSLPPAEPTTPQECQEYIVYVRGRKCGQDLSVAFKGDTPEKAFESALDEYSGGEHEPIMYWTSKDDIVAIDIDYHCEEKPDPNSLFDAAIHRIKPRPSYAWITHGGGVRLIYFRSLIDQKFTALDQAILAMLRVVPFFHKATSIEIKKDTRHPKFPRADGSKAGAVLKLCESDPGRCVSRLLGTYQTVDEFQVDEWLEENGFTRGQRLSHTQCPIDPTSDDKRDCVIVGDAGIFCYRCDSMGIAYPGCSRAGFVPYAKLIESSPYAGRFNHLRQAVNSFCHWAHAKYIIKYHTGLPEREAEMLYSLLLRLRHVKSDDKVEIQEAVESRIDRCFFPKIPIVRADGYWAHPDDLSTPYTDKGVGKMISALPAVHYIDRDSGKIKSDRLKTGMFESNGDLSDYGYPFLEPIRGADIARLIPMSDGNEQSSKGIPALIPSDQPFRYQNQSARTESKFDYKEHIKKRFPGVNIDLLKLLIAAKGFCQRSASEPPRLLITGQSGGGKTATVLLAAVITRDSMGKLPIDTDPEKFIRNYATEAKRNGYVFSDEVAKSRLSPTDLCARLLHVSRETTYHQLYVGSTRVGRLAVHVMADTLVPRAMREEVQLARRIVHADLGAGVNQATIDWRVEGDIDQWLTTHYDAARNRTAADMLVSEVMDEVSFEGETFEGYAKRRGFNLLRDASDGVDGDAAFKELFMQAINTPDCVQGQWKGPGWKVFTVDDHQSPLAKAFRECTEDAEKGDHQMITGRQWGQVLRIPGLVCDVSPHRRKVGIRFRVGESRSANVRYNREVLPEGDPRRGTATPSILSFPSTSGVLPDASLAGRVGG